MQRKLVVLAALSLAFSTTAFAETWKGTISDSMCGAKHVNAAAADVACAQKCVKGGSPAVLVVGDKIYGPDEGCYLRFIETSWTPELARVLWLDRHALHAWRLTFDHGPGERRAVEAPLPGDMAAF